MTDAERSVPEGRPRWAYTPEASGRDLRVDFMRGVVMAVLLVVHVEVFSLFSLVAWERFGLIAGAEGFVILSGLVLGMVHRRTIAEQGWHASVSKLIKRAAQLWRVNVFVIVSIGLLALLPFLDASAVTTFVDRGSGQVYPLYPAHGADPWPLWLAKAATLRMGPHEIQILGLYVALLALTPLALFVMRQGWTRYWLGLCAVVYFFNLVQPSMPTGTQFEYAFPLLTWQLIYFCGLAAGFHRDRVEAFFAGRWGRWAVGASLVVFTACLFLAQNATNPFLPPWAHLRVVPAATFDALYAAYFQKNTLGFGRLLNYAAALVTAFTVLTVCWRPLYRALGWYFVPVGQATLYVFIVHIYVILAVTQVVKFGLAPTHILAHTLLHAGVLALVWLMVRYKVLYQWIPR